VKKRVTKQVATDGQVLMDHIRELRTRLIVCAIVLIVGGIVGYFFYEEILVWLRSPLGADLYYSTPAGSFNFIIKVASMVGILAAVPFIIFQLIMFIRPVVAEKLSATRVVFYTLASIGLAVTGALFAFYAILPGALKFFAGFQVAGLSALIDANNYLNFVTNAIVTFILVFQIPLVMIIIDRIKPISPKKLLSMEKYVILGGLVVSLMVPFALDITTSLLIASPIVILYNISVGMIVIRHLIARRRTVDLPVVAEMTAEEIAMDDQQVVDFFNSRSQKVPALAIEPIEDEVFDLSVEELPTIPVLEVETHQPTPILKKFNLPRDTKPLPGQIPNVAQLRADAQANRERQIAERVARYNTGPLRIINDIN